MIHTIAMHWKNTASSEYKLNARQIRECLLLWAADSEAYSSSEGITVNGVSVDKHTWEAQLLLMGIV